VLGKPESLNINQVKLVLKMWVTGFDPGSVQMKVLVEKVTLGQVIT